jgi:hypothetical protein
MPCRAPSGRLPTRLGSPWTGLAHRPSWHGHRQVAAAVSSPAMLLRVPYLGRAGAANHPPATVSSGQPRTTAPQVNPPVRWQRDRLDLAYNDQVTASSPVTPTSETAGHSPCGGGRDAPSRSRLQLTEVCPARAATSLGFAPTAIHSATAVYRRSWMRSPSIPAALVAAHLRSLDPRQRHPTTGILRDHAGHRRRPP